MDIFYVNKSMEAWTIQISFPKSIFFGFAKCVKSVEEVCVDPVERSSEYLRSEDSKE